MSTKTLPKKRNAQDITIRNLRAVKQMIADELHRRVTPLERRVSKLEERQA